MSDKLIEAAVNAGISAYDIAKCLGEDHVANGYKGNSGRDRCVRKDGTFDYLKMGRLVHSNNW